jgi:hypothetical protein
LKNVTKTEWQHICTNNIQGYKFERLQEIAKALDIPTANKTKRQLCAAISQDFSNHMEKRARPECHNVESFAMRDPWDEIPNWKILRVQQGGKTYCFTLEELETLIKTQQTLQNPYTRQEIDKVDTQTKINDKLKIRKLHQPEKKPCDICKAVKLNKIDVVKQYLDNKGDPNKMCKGYSLLMIAAENGLEIPKLLIARGADVNMKNEKGMTALILAAKSGMRGIVEILLENNADINIADKDGNTALHWAARENFPNTTTMLIDGRANVNIKNLRGQTPLHLTTSFRCMKGLIRSGADFTIKDPVRNREFFGKSLALGLRQNVYVRIQEDFDDYTDDSDFDNDDSGISEVLVISGLRT